MKHNLSESVFASLFADSCWMKFSKLLLRDLTTDEAVLLCYLINTRQIHSAEVKENDGWFYSQMKYIIQDLWLTRSKQTALIRKLKEKGFIETKKKDHPARRYIRIKFKTIRRSITQALKTLESMNYRVFKSEHSRVFKSEHSVYIYKRNTKRDPSVLRTRDARFAESCCDELLKVILKDSRLASKYNTFKWNKSQSSNFTAIVKALKGDENKFLNVFEWLLDNLSDYKNLKLPSSISPKSIRKNWSWIEDKYDQLHPRQQDEKVKVSKEAKSIAHSLSHLSWPKGSYKQLPKMIQLGLNFYGRFQYDIAKYVKKHFTFDKMTGDYEPRKKSSRTGGRQYALRQLAVRLNRIMDRNLIENWYRELNGRLHKYDKWKGDLYGMRFKEDDLIKYGKQFSPYFEELMEIVNAR